MIIEISLSFHDNVRLDTKKESSLLPVRPARGPLGEGHSGLMGNPLDDRTRHMVVSRSTSNIALVCKPSTKLKTSGCLRQSIIQYQEGF